MSQLPRANKALGQHFLVDKNIIEKITSDFKDSATSIVEVGPGPGVLTESLAAHDLPIHVIDKDERFPEYLEKILPKESVHITDALKWDLEEGFKEWGFLKDGHKIWLVSNLPYNVASPLFVKFLQAPSLSFMTLMFQREVADKAFAIDTRKGKAMNSLMALSQTYFEVSLLCKVAPGAFNPPPKVESAVLSFKRLSEPVIALSNFKSYEKFLRHLFQFKRKQMGKVLKSNYTPEEIETILSQLSIDPRVRAEALDLENIQKLFLAFKALREKP